VKRNGAHNSGHAIEIAYGLSVELFRHSLRSVGVNFVIAYCNL